MKFITILNLIPKFDNLNNEYNLILKLIGFLKLQLFYLLSIHMFYYLIKDFQYQDHYMCQRLNTIES